MKISMSTFVYYRYPLVDCLRHLRKLGYEAAEIWGGRPHAYYEDMTPKRIDELKEVLDQLGMRISSFIPAQFRYPTNIACSDELIRENSVNYIKRNIDVAEALGSPYVSICPGYSMRGDTAANAGKALLRSIEELIAHARDYKSKLILEPGHHMETDLIVTVDDAIELIERVGRENLGLCVDIGHLAVNKENISEIADIAKSFTVHYHIDDNRGNADEHLIPGDGSVSFEPFLSNLKKSGYQGYLTVELGFDYTKDPDAASFRSLRQMKELLKDES